MKKHDEKLLKELREAQTHVECMCRYEGRIATIERVFIGRGIWSNFVRAKLIMDTGSIVYANFGDYDPF